MARLEINIVDIVSIKKLVMQAETNMFLFLTQDDPNLQTELNLLGIQVEDDEL